MKPDCYKCEYRGSIPGDEHSKCYHPDMVEILENPTYALLAIIGKRTKPIKTKGKLKVKGNPIGIRGGWFNHPFNFDPTWLESCNGFKEK